MGRDGTRAAIVTGGAQGIGRGVVQRLLGEGWAVCSLDRDREAAEALAAETGAGGRLLSLAGDVASEGDVRTAVDEAVGAFGGLDGLVNNAGIARNVPCEELSREDWDRVLAVNLTGPFLFARCAAPHLRRARGAVVNVASTRALMSEPNTEAYSASKGGVLALTHALAVSLAPEVRVNCVSPGWIEVSAWRKPPRRAVPRLSDADHAQHPAGRVGRPEDVAGLVSYLLSDAAGFVTGANFVVDGGMTRKMIYVE